MSNPATMPETIPEPEIDATVVLLEDQVPPVVASFRAILKPSQTLFEPEIFEGSGLIVTFLTVVHPPVKV